MNGYGKKKVSGVISEGLFVSNVYVRTKEDYLKESE